jgi:hypothetical protein
LTNLLRLSRLTAGAAGVLAFGDLGNDKSISRGGRTGFCSAKFSAGSSFAAQKFFPLETFFYFSNFFGQLEGGSRRLS